MEKNKVTFWKLPANDFYLHLLDHYSQWESLEKTIFYLCTFVTPNKVWGLLPGNKEMAFERQINRPCTEETR